MKNQTPMAPNQTFAYIQQMLKELRILSENENASILAYLIEMAFIEASDLKDGIHAPKREADISVSKYVGSLS